MNAISVLFALVSIGFTAHGAPLGNAMQPEFHATALAPMITGTNVPESEEEIDAPIYDQDEIEKVKALAHETAQNARNPESAPLVGDFIRANPGLLSTVETGTVEDGSGPIFTLPAAVPTLSSQ
ncbi:unnamed protein product [Caenorhabditis sp. 36 PRJEB53466]|nr:unnamed protein product [Caenorhabditis sp. 36 PRJEB53466]